MGRAGWVEGRETKLTPMHWPNVLEWVLVSSMVTINRVLMELSTVINHSFVQDCFFSHCRNKFQYYGCRFLNLGVRGLYHAFSCILAPGSPTY